MGARPVERLAVRESRAAAMLDLKPAEFRALVDAGALPPPFEIGGHKRWRVDQISAILGGKAAIPEEDFTL